jgi:predicted dehydrogenase
MKDSPSNETVSRRGFLKSSSAVAGGVALGSLAIEKAAFAAHHDEIKIALIGCGGRGTGAISQALNTHDIGPVKLIAVADAFRDQIDRSIANVKKQHGDRVDVPEENKFVGFDGYKQAIALADVVILATPPGFRPIHFEEAVKQGKHIFMEKPVAVDAPGVQKVLKGAKAAKAKGLKIGVGLQRHHEKGYLETIQRLHDGAIGDIHSMRCYWNGGGVWDPRKKRDEVGSEMEYQMRNWYYYNWLCGDHITEQHIHNIDVINWVKRGYPVKAQGMGGRQVRTEPHYGEIYDHHFVEFEYADGTRCYSQCRHIPNCWNSVSEAVIGSKGRSDVNRFQIFGDNKWRHNSKGDVNPYQQEHHDLFTAIRKNENYSEAENGAMSTMCSILGRMCTYSGKKIEMKNALASTVDLSPERYDWDANPVTLPDKDGRYPIAMPGINTII